MGNRYDVDSAFVQRQLTQIRQRVLTKDYPDVKWDLYVPMEEGVSPAAESYAVEMMDSRGEARVTKNYADDTPLQEVVLEESTSGIVGITHGYDYHIQDLRKAQMTGMDLRSAKATAARQRIEYKIDELVAAGSAAHGITGFLNDTNVDTANVANPGSGTAWSVKSADERNADIFEAIQTIIDNTNGIEDGQFDILLPPGQHFLLTSRLGDTPMTGLQFLQQSVPAIRSINSWWRLSGAGAGSTDRMLVYKRDPEKVAAVVPIRFNMLPTETRGFKFVTLMEARCGGALWHKPKSAAYRDGI